MKRLRSFHFTFEDDGDVFERTFMALTVGVAKNMARAWARSMGFQFVE